MLSNQDQVFVGCSLPREPYNIYFRQGGWFSLFLQKAIWVLLEINSLFTQHVTHRPIPASQENKESCNNFIRTMCFALEYFIINIKPPSPSPTPTHPLWILLCYILKLKNNISIHFSVSRYNLTHEMTSLNVILLRRQTLGLYTMDFLSSFMPVFQSQLGSYYPG